MRNMVDFYNQQVDIYKELIKRNSNVDVNKALDHDPKKISWTRNL